MNDSRDFRGRKLVDDSGNTYVVDIPIDVSLENMEDILIGGSEGTAKPRAHKPRDDAHRHTNNEPCEENTRYKSSAYRILNIADQNTVSLKEFNKAIQTLFEWYKKDQSKIGKPRISTYQGKPIRMNENGNYYIEREVRCAATGCNNVIKGKLPIVFKEDGTFDRCQKFKPQDRKADRVRPGSKHWFCSACAVKRISPDVVQFSELKDVKTFSTPELHVEPSRVHLLQALNRHPVAVPIEQAEPAFMVEPAVFREPAGVNPFEAALEMLLNLSDPKSDTDPVYFKGLAHGLLKMWKEKQDELRNSAGLGRSSRRQQ